jgi:hypothetical protein
MPRSPKCSSLKRRFPKPKNKIKLLDTNCTTDLEIWICSYRVYPETSKEEANRANQVPKNPINFLKKKLADSLWRRLETQELENAIKRTSFRNL